MDGNRDLIAAFASASQEEVDLSCGTCCRDAILTPLAPCNFLRIGQFARRSESSNRFGCLFTETFRGF